MGLSPLLAGYDNVVLDLDGCVWVGPACTREAPQAISELRAAGKRLAFLTNNAQSSPEDYVRKLWSLGIQASLEEVVTAGAAVQYFLSGQAPRNAYVIGSEALVKHVADAGIDVGLGHGADDDPAEEAVDDPEDSQKNES